MNDFSWAFLNNNDKLYWKGICNKARNIAIFDIENIVNQYGFITDFHMFSDMEISVVIVIEECKIDKLYADLRNYISMDAFSIPDSTSEKERVILLQITFVTNTGDLRVEVPAVPG